MASERLRPFPYGALCQSFPLVRLLCKNNVMITKLIVGIVLFTSVLKLLYFRSSCVFFIWRKLQLKSKGGVCCLRSESTDWHPALCAVASKLLQRRAVLQGSVCFHIILLARRKSKELEQISPKHIITLSMNISILHFIVSFKDLTCWTESQSQTRSGLNCYNFI